MPRLFDFNVETSFFHTSDFSGIKLETNLPAIRNYQSEVKVLKAGEEVLVEYSTVVNNGKIEIIFSSYLESVEVSVKRNALLREPLAQSILSNSYVTSWLSGATQALQDVAINRYLNNLGRYLFSLGRRIIFLAPPLDRTVLTLVRNFNFFFNHFTLGLVSQCDERPNKDSYIKNTEITIEKRFQHKYSVPLKELQNLGATDKNTGLKFLGNELCWIKSFSAGGNLLVQVFKAYFSGVDIALNTDIFRSISDENYVYLLIGGERFSCRVQEREGFYELSSGQKTTTLNLSESDQPVAILVNGGVIPLISSVLEPSLPLVNECGNAEVGEPTNIVDWL